MDEERLAFYAVRTPLVHDLVGMGRRDPERAERHWRWAQRYGCDAVDPAWDLLALSTRTLLWLGDEALPLDGHPDGYWHGLQAIVASVARDVFTDMGVTCAADLDRRFARWEAPETLRPTALSQRPDLDLPEAVYVDVRVIPHDAVEEMTRFCMEAVDSFDPMVEWLGGFSRPLLADCDLWLFSPGMPLLAQRPGVEDAPAG